MQNLSWKVGGIHIHFSSFSLVLRSSVKSCANCILYNLCPLGLCLGNLTYRFGATH